MGWGPQPLEGQVEFIRSYFKALDGIKKRVQTLPSGWDGGPVPAPHPDEEVWGPGELEPAGCCLELAEFSPPHLQGKCQFLKALQGAEVCGGKILGVGLWGKGNNTP